MSIYLDASVLVALFIDDVLSDRADAFIRSHRSILIVSDFAAAEFSSAVARHVRMKSMTAAAARRAFTVFDVWVARAAQPALTTSRDVAAAAALVRRLYVPLRTPDALNIAITQRLDAALFTFDEKMATSARALGTTVLRA